MTVKELAAAAGITRQWLNVRVNRDEVPGVTRGANGRLMIQSSDELLDWVSQNRKMLSGQRGRRLIAKQRSQRLSASESYLTVGEVAEMCACSSETIRSKALLIPGFRMHGMRYRFEDSERLRRWIEREAEQSLLRRKQVHRLRLNHGRGSVIEIYAALQRFRFTLNRQGGAEAFKHQPPAELDYMLGELSVVHRFASELMALRQNLKKRPSPPSPANAHRANARRSS